MWKYFEGDDLEWERILSRKVGQNYLVGNEWMNHMTNLGWNVERFVYQKGSSIEICQGFCKRYFFGFYVYWFPEWILGDYRTSSSLLTFIKERKNSHFIYLRLRSHRKKNFVDQVILELSFKKAKKQIDSAKTMLLDLNQGKDKLHDNLRKNWKRNLKRSNKIKHKIIKITDVSEIIKLYKTLAGIKKIESSLYTEEEIRSIFNVFSSSLLVYGCQTEDGEIHAIRGALSKSNKTTDIFAAANLFARKNYLSYAVCWHLITQSINVAKIYDLNGVDEKNTGVYNFKRGTGAYLHETLGEFEFSSNIAVSFLIDLYFLFKK